MDFRVSVLIGIRSKLAGLNQASAGFGRFIKSVAMRLFGESGAIPHAPVSQWRRNRRRPAGLLGQMPELLQRNSAQFERIDTLLGRLSNKSRQLFVGLGGMLADELTA